MYNIDINGSNNSSGNNNCKKLTHQVSYSAVVVSAGWPGLGSQVETNCGVVSADVQTAV